MLSCVFNLSVFTQDDAFPSNHVYSDLTINFIKAVPPNTRVVLSKYQLVVYGGSWSRTDTDALAVHLCCYASADTECPPLDALE